HDSREQHIRPGALHLEDELCRRAIDSGHVDGPNFGVPQDLFDRARDVDAIAHVAHPQYPFRVAPVLAERFGHSLEDVIAEGVLLRKNGHLVWVHSLGAEQVLQAGRGLFLEAGSVVEDVAVGRGLTQEVSSRERTGEEGFLSRACGRVFSAVGAPTLQTTPKTWCRSYNSRMLAKARSGS